jgi:hypothetical protein
MIVVAGFLMMGAQVSGVFGHFDIALDYMVSAADGSLIPVVVD